ncbi:uncharacterized protein LOC112517865 [Cynara cardunculus var. scolymus]|uniref:Uncharacterized protein n=1 Tax=Cynara cardunculus var. scolymus TaxID=59895 RepID=A0A103XNM6_CYNCS|nr:uncharacterized protein LOC112517865 [Cynara cardunculus var. scolymus]KVH94156.1 Protein of unknown function DUF1191 [Cynara cardunculus var. scolymus]
MISFAYYCLIFTILFIKIPIFKAQSSLPTQQLSFSSRFLDSVLQDYAFRPFSRRRPRTGVVYDGNVPSNLTGATVSALRLRTGSLRKRGFHGYKEFDIPKGILENPYVERVILVYHNLGNLSSLYYPLPGYLFLSPVVGLLAYNAMDLTAKGLPELDLRASENPILVTFKTLGILPNGVSPKCVFFDLFGGVAFDHVMNGSVCSSVTQGHFGIVVEEITPPPVAPPPRVTEDPIAGGRGGGGNGGRKKGWWVGGSVAGGVLLAAVVGVLVMWVRWYRGTKRIGRMKDAAEGGVPLTVAAVGRAKVPMALGTRTKPILETEYVS